jgi:crossover junction endodeoxyribonuclease RusA
VTLTFTVYGVAQPKGNMRAIRVRGMKFPIVTDSNRNAKSWSQLVAEGANRALGEAAPEDRGVLVDAVRVALAFYLPRPKKYQRRGVPVAHLTKPDLDKLVRGVLDALTHVVWRDDSQVVELLAGKFYAEVDDAPHVDIRVTPTAGTQPVAVPAAPLPLFEARALLDPCRP